MSIKTQPRPLPEPNGDCPECRGNGKIGMYQERCNTCDGTGYYPKPTTREVMSIDEKIEEVLKGFARAILLQIPAKSGHSNYTLSEAKEAIKQLIKEEVRRIGHETIGEDENFLSDFPIARDLLRREQRKALESTLQEKEKL